MTTREERESLEIADASEGAEPLAPAREVPKRFCVAFSFANEQREFVQAAVQLLEQKLGPSSVFYDDWFRHYIAGNGGDLKLESIYANAELVIVGVSAEYGTKGWTQTEWEAIRARQLEARRNGSSEQWLLPLRLGDGDVQGLPSNAIIPDVREHSAEQVVQLILGRLELATAPLLRPASVLPSLSPKAIKVRERYLKDARKDIQGRLDESIHHARFIDLGIADDPTALKPGWVFQNPDTKRDYGSIQDAFVESEGRLLVLGHPGSGKSTSLLHLAKHLLDQAQRDVQAPVPVVVNISKFRFERPRRTLATWKRTGGQSRGDKLEVEVDAGADTRLSDWFIDELKERDVPRNIAGDWLKSGRVAALLDGLDEFNDARRAELVKLLNETFLKEHRELVVVVCSRINEYVPLRANLETRLQLRAAVELQPLSDADIGSYLKSSRADGLLQALPDDAVLKDMARTPLTLSMLVLAYGGAAPPADSTASLAERRHRLFESYVARMLQREVRHQLKRDYEVPVSEYPYDPERVDRYLGWLAITLSLRMRTTFSLSHFHALMRAGLASSRRLDFLAVHFAQGAIVAFVVALLAIGIAPRTQAGLATVATTILVVWALTPPTAALLHHWPALRGLVRFGSWTLFWGAVAQGASELLPGRFAPLLLTGSVLAMGAGARLARDSRPGESIDSPPLAAIASFAVLYVAFQLGGFALGLDLAIFSILVLAQTLMGIVVGSFSRQSVLRTLSKPPLERWGSISGMFKMLETTVPVVAGACGVTWLLAELSWVRALLLLATWSTMTLAVGDSVAAALSCLVAFVGLIGGLLAQLSGALSAIGAMAFVGFVRGAFDPPRRLGPGSPMRAVAWATSESRSWLVNLIEHTLLSPALLVFLIVTGRIPPFFRRFLRFAHRAFLLKHASHELEFVHRLLRDYFALRDLLPRINQLVGSERLDAIHALGFQGEAALDLLSELADHRSDGSVRAAAVTALGHIASPTVQRLLAQRVEDPSPEVRCALLKVVFENGNNDRNLLTLLQDMQPLGDGCEIDALLGDRASALLGTEKFLVAFRARLGTSAFDPLMHAIVSKDPERRCRAASWLGELGDRRALDAVLHCLQDRNARVRRAAVYALSIFQDARVIEPLLTQLKQADSNWVREEVVDVLASLGEKATIEPLRLHMLRERHVRVRVGIVHAFGKFKDPQAEEALLAQLGDRAADVRLAILKVIHQFPTPKTRKEILRYLEDSNARVREEACRVLARFEPTEAVLEQLAKQLDDKQRDVRCAAAIALRSAGDARGQEAFARFLDDRASALRRSAVRAFAQGSDDLEFYIVASGEDRYIDPRRVVSLALVARIARQHQHPTVDIRECLERVAPELGLKLEWKS